MHSALFLDRDGIVNQDYGYVHKIEDFHFVDGIFELVRAANKFNLLVFVVTNQAGIGRGYYTETCFNELTNWMIEQFVQNKCHINDVYYCPYHPVHGIGNYRCDHYDRKPNPGMILKLSEKYNVDVNKSWLIGDNLSDMLAGQTSGIRNNFLITRLSKSEVTSDAMPSNFHVRESLSEITDLLIDEFK